MNFAHVSMKGVDVNLKRQLYMIYPVRGYRLPNGNLERSPVKPLNHILRITRLPTFCHLRLLKLIHKYGYESDEHNYQAPRENECIGWF